MPDFFISCHLNVNCFENEIKIQQYRGFKGADRDENDFIYMCVTLVLFVPAAWKSYIFFISNLGVGV